MGALEMFIGLGSASVTCLACMVAYRARQKKKRNYHYQYQIQVKRDGLHQKRKKAVKELQMLLRAALTDLAYSNGGQGATYAAQGIAEAVFYDWLNHNFSLFYCAAADSYIRITGTHKGQFTYELPDQLNQYVKG
jgi:hypothetical protein